MAGSSIVGILKVLLTADTAQYESAMKRAGLFAKQTSADLGMIGRQATQMGSALTKTLTLPLLALGGGAAKLAIDFESSFAGVRKTVNATEPEFQAMAQSFRNLSQLIPVNVNELNRLGEAAGALGIPKKEIVDFARVMALLGVTTNVTSDQAASSIAKIQNIFGAAGKDTERFASTLVALGNDGASTEHEILELANRIASAGHAVGLSQGQVLGFASAIANVGIEAEAGGSAMSKVLIDISQAVSKGGADLEGFARTAGMSGTAFAAAFRTDAADATRLFIEGLGRMKKEGGDLNLVIADLGFTEIRQSNLLRSLALSGDNLTKALTLQGKAWSDNTALTNEANQRFKTTESQLILLWNRVKDVGITLGNALLPMIQATIKSLEVLLPFVARLADGFAKMPVPLQAGVVGFGLLVAAAGPALWVFGQLVTASASVVGAFATKGIATRGLALAYNGLTVAAATFASVARGVAASFLGLSAPVVAIVAVVGALAYAWVRMTGDWTRAFDVLFPPLGFLRMGWDNLKKAIEPHKQLLSDIASIVSSSLTIALHVLKSALGDVYDGLAKAATIFVGVKNGVMLLVDWVGTKAVWAFGELKKAAESWPGFTVLLAIFERMQSAGATVQVAMGLVAGKLKGVADAVTDVQKPTVAATRALQDIHDRAIKPLTTGLELFNRQGENSGAVMASLIASGAGYTTELQRMKDKVAALTAEQRKQIDAGRALGKSEEAIAKQLSLSEEVVRLYKASTEALGKSEKKRVTDAIEHGKKLNELEGKIADENAKFRAQAIQGYEEQRAAMKKYWQDYDNARGEQGMKDAAYWDQWGQKAVTAFTNSLVPFKAAVLAVSPKSQVWAQAWGSMKEGLMVNLAQIPATLARAFEGGGDIWGAVKSIGSQIGAGIGEAIGLAMGGGSKAAGAIGAALGSLVGPVMEGFKKLFGIGMDPVVKQANEDLAKLKGELMKNHGSLELLEQAANRVGISFKNAWGETGQQGLRDMTALVAEFERRTTAIAEASALVITGFTAVAAGMTAPYLALGKSIDEAREKAAEATAKLAELQANEKSGADAIATAQADVAAAAATLNGLLGEQARLAGTSKQALQDIGLQGIAAFGAAMLAGASYGEAMKKVGPSLRQIADAYTALGLEVDDVGLKHLLLQAEVVDKNPQLIAAIDGLGMSMNGLAQLGLLNVDTFAAMQRTGMEMYARLQGEVALVGGTTRDALLPMQGYLQEAAAKAVLLGIPIDANTQMLIDQSKELGIWKDKGKSASDRVIDGMQALVDKVGELLDHIMGIGGAIDRMPSTKVITFQAQYIDPGPPDGFGDPNRGGNGDPGWAGGTFGRLGKWFGSFPKAGFATALHGVEAVITPGQAVPFAMDMLAGMGAGGSSVGVSMAGVEQRLDALTSQLALRDRLLPAMISSATRTQPGRRR